MLLYVEVGRKYLNGTLPEEWGVTEWKRARRFVASYILEAEREAQKQRAMFGG